MKPRPSEPEGDPATRKIEQTAFQAQLMDPARSSYDKYRELTVGSGGKLEFLKYEILTFLLGPLPGAVGYFLRKIFYPKLLGECGRGVVFGRNIVLRHPAKIQLGTGCVIDDNCVLDAKGAGNRGICCGDHVLLARNTVLSCKGGDITIDANTNISMNCIIHSESSVHLGRNILIAAYCYIVGGGAHGYARTDIPIIQQESVSRGIEMGDDIWLGAGVMILDGVTVGTGCVIGAGSLVSKSLPPWSVAAGSPARVARRRLSEEERLEKEKGKERD